MKPLFSLLIAISFIPCFAWAKSAPLFLPDAVEEADIIAHIRVLENTDLSPPRPRHRRNEDGSVTVEGRFFHSEEYQRTATVIVVPGIKGGQKGQPLLIGHSNGLTCPNVFYETGGEYLVFLKKIDKNPGEYATMNYYAGQFPIKDGKVLHFYLWKGFEASEKAEIPYEQVAAFLKTLMEKKNP